MFGGENPRVPWPTADMLKIGPWGELNAAYPALLSMAATVGLLTTVAWPALMEAAAVLNSDAIAAIVADASSGDIAFSAALKLLMVFWVPPVKKLLAIRPASATANGVLKAPKTLPSMAGMAELVSMLSPVIPIRPAVSPRDTLEGIPGSGVPAADGSLPGADPDVLEPLSEALSSAASPP